MWPGSDHDSDRLDRAIAEVARQMTEGAPSADLKSRVLALLGERERLWFSRRLVWTMAPIAAAVVIALVVAGRVGNSGDRRRDAAATQAPANAAPRPDSA